MGNNNNWEMVSSDLGFTSSQGLKIAGFALASAKQSFQPFQIRTKILRLCFAALSLIYSLGTFNYPHYSSSRGQIGWQPKNCTSTADFDLTGSA